MSIQNIIADLTPSKRLALSWEVVDMPIALSVQVAQDPEFKVLKRTFVLPHTCRQCALDLGGGTWYYRVGAWAGTAQEGEILWSGVYPPVRIDTDKPIVAVRPFDATLFQTKPSLNSVVFYTDLKEPHYMVFTRLQEGNLTARTFYSYDWGSGQIHLGSLKPEHTYSVQLQHFATSAKGELPTDSIVALTGVHTIHGLRCAAPLRPTTSVDHTEYSADKALIQDSLGRQSMKFSSQTDYLRFVTAKARTSLRPS